MLFVAYYVDLDLKELIYAIFETYLICHTAYNITPKRAYCLSSLQCLHTFLFQLLTTVTIVTVLKIYLCGANIRLQLSFILSLSNIYRAA